MSATLPPGQSLTQRFPVVGESAPSNDASNLESWRLHLGGPAAAGRLELAWPDIAGLGWQERTVDIHCVTGWTHRAMRFGGIPLRYLIELAGGARHEARFVRFEAYSSRRHDTTLPFDVALADTWLVHAINDEPLTVEHGYPLRCVTPSRYFYKSCKWVHRIELLAEDRLGYWEATSNYHNVGDPTTGEQRFTSGSVRPSQALAFSEATDFTKWRGRVLIGLDLAGWHRPGADLQEVALKGCDLRRANLAGADLRRANLSLSDLRHANLADTDFRGADLEGADLRGADLRNADLGDTFLTATRFANSDGNDPHRGALLAGCRFGNNSGLLEDQERYVAQFSVS